MIMIWWCRYFFLTTTTYKIFLTSLSRLEAKQWRTQKFAKGRIESKIYPQKTNYAKVPRKAQKNFFLSVFPITFEAGGGLQAP